MNNKIINRLVAGIITSALLMSITVAYPNKADAAATQTLDLKGFISEVITNSSAIKIYDEKIEIQKRRCNTANSVADAAKTKPWLSDVEHVKNKKDELLYTVQAQDKLDDLVWQRQDKVNSLTLDATKLYYEFSFKEKEISAQTKAVELAKKELDLKKKQVNLGTSASTIINQYTLALSQQQQALENLNREYNNLKMSINKLLQRDLKQAVNLKLLSLTIQDYKCDNLDKIIADQREKNYSVITIKNQYNETKIERDIVYSYTMMEKPEGGEALDDKLVELSHSIGDKQTAVEYDIRTKYNNILNLKNSIDIAKMTYDISVKKYDIDKIKYDKGLITITDLLKTSGEMDSAFVAYSKSQLDYFTAIQEFKNYIA